MFLRQRTFNSWIIFLMEMMGLMGTAEMTNIWLQVCEFELQITTFYVQSASPFAL